MQTFLPYKSYAASAAVLDRARLGKQRVETMQLMTALTGVKVDKRDKLVRVKQSSWANHPAAKMWRGYERELLRYQYAICSQWSSRGYQDSCLEKTERIYMVSKRLHLILGEPIKPEWLDDAFCLAHRSNLIRKKPEHYGQIWPDIPDDLPYIWPVA